MSGTQEETTTEATEEKVVEGQVETTEEGGQSTEGQETESKTEGQDTDGQGKKEKPWFQKRIDDLTKDKWDARREKEAAEARARELEAQLEILKAGKKDGDPEVKNLTDKDIERLAEQKAEEKVRVEAFNKACNDVYEAGKAAYNDFEDVLKNYRDIGGLTPGLIEAALETGEGHKVLYELGKDRDLAYKIMKMSPVKMGVEVSKVAAKVSQPPKPAPVSKAPAPIKPVKGAANAEPDPEKMSTAEWMEWREKKLEEERKKRLA